MSVARSIMWSFTGNGVQFVSSLITGMIVARLLAPAEIGGFAVGVSTLAVIQAMLQMGLAGFLIREQHVHPELLGSAVSVAFLQGLAITSVLLLAAPLAGEFQRSAAVTDIVLLIAPVPLLASVEAIAVALWTREMNFRRIAYLTTFKASIQALASIGLALAGYGAASLAIGYLLAAALGLAGAAPSLRRVRPNLAHWRRLTKFGSLWMLLGGIRALNARMPEFLLGRMISLSAVGFYNRASASVEMVSKAGINPLASVMLPVLSRELRETGSMSDGIIRLSSTLTAIFWPVLAALALLAEPVIVVLYGGQWRPAAPVLSVLSLWLAVALAGTGAGEALLLGDRLRFIAWVEGIRTAAAVVILATVAPLGLVAVAAARVVETAVGVVPYIFAMRTGAGLSLSRWVGAQTKSLAVTLLAVGPLWIFRSLVEQPDSPLLQLLEAAPIFLGAHLAALLLLRHPLVGVMHRIVGSLLLDRRRPRGEDVP